MTSIKSCLLDVNSSNYNRAGAAETLLSGLMVSMQKEQSRGCFICLFISFFCLDEVARHKDEWLLSLRTPGLTGWFNWVELNLSQVEMETERKSMMSIYKSL